MAMKERTGRSRVSKADEIARKIDTPAPTQTSARVRPNSKADEISRKINTPASAPTSARVRPSSKADEISRKIPSQPAAAPERPSRPAPAERKSYPAGTCFAAGPVKTVQAIHSACGKKIKRMLPASFCPGCSGNHRSPGHNLLN